MSNIKETQKPVILSEDKFVLTKIELILNRIFAVLLIISSPLLLFNILTIPTVIIFVIFALFLLFAKRYHPAVNIIFLLFALGVYFIPLPIGWGFYLGLREFKFNGYAFNLIIIFFYLSPFIFISFSVRNFLGNIIAYFKPNTRLRNILYIISLSTVMVIMLAYPLTESIKLRHQAMENSTGTSLLSSIITTQEIKVKPGESASSSAYARRSYTAQFDSNTQQYIYHLTLSDPIIETVSFKTVKTDGKAINFQTDRQVECMNCQKEINDPNVLIFPAGRNIDFIISSKQFIKVIEFTELSGSVISFVFWK